MSGKPATAPRDWMKLRLVMLMVAILPGTIVLDF